MGIKNDLIAAQRGGQNLILSFKGGTFDVIAQSGSKYER